MEKVNFEDLCLTWQERTGFYSKESVTEICQEDDGMWSKDMK